jgi:hypothetical protein
MYLWTYRCCTFGKPLLQDMWGPKKGRTDIVEGVGFEGSCAALGCAYSEARRPSATACWRSEVPGGVS